MTDKDEDFPLKREEMDRLLGSPNNLLGIEYCKAILRQDSPLISFTIRYRGQGYHNNGPEGEQTSASAIRRTLKAEVPSGEAGLSPYAKLTPKAMTHIPPEIRPLYGREPVLKTNNLLEILSFCLLSLKREGTDYTQYGDMSAEMARRLDHCLPKQISWEGHTEQLKTRQYTYTRLSRALLHMVLGLTDARVQSYKEAGRTPYARVLGFRKESQGLLALVKQKTAIPLITKTIDAPRILIRTALDMFSQDIYAFHIRQTLFSKKLEQPVRNEYSHPICIL